MSNCPANLVVGEVVPFNMLDASWMQGVINRLGAYWDKYNVGTIRETKRIGYVHSKYDPDVSEVTYHQTVLHSLLEDIRSTMDDYKDTYLGDGGDFSWGSVPRYSRIRYQTGDGVKVHLTDLESQCWACHTGDTDPTCSICHTVEHTCETGDICDCYSTYYSEEGCTCYASCYGQCECNMSTYGYVPCTCNMASHNAGLYSYAAFCGCHNACYGYSCTCHNTCYNQSYCTACDSVCHPYTCTCNSLCYGDACSCDAQCYTYDPDCTQCYSTTY